MTEFCIPVQLAADISKNMSDLVEQLKDGKRFYVKEYADGSFELMLEQPIRRMVYNEDGSAKYAQVFNGKIGCNGCVFLNTCKGDGDGTEAEGLICQSGYIWESVNPT